MRDRRRGNERAVRPFSVTLFCVLFVLCVIPCGCAGKGERKTLHIAMPYSDYVQDPETNYYIGWLKEKTGLELEITLIRQSRCEEYMEALFSSDAEVDLVFFGEDFRLSDAAYRQYAEEGKLLSGADEYYFNDGGGRSDGAGQVLWINYNWLTKLNLQIPQTTAELKRVLEAFRDLDPNGNGIRDEIPIVGSTEEYAFLPTEFLLNSFVYNDPYHSRYGIGERKDLLMAETDAFREGVRFCNGLYEEGLLEERSFLERRAQMTELINSPEDVVGAFTTASISDVIYPGNPEVLARFVHVAPPAGASGKCYALYTRHDPDIGAVILASSHHAQEAKLLLDTMMTPEASLIARYGEQGVDWDYSDGRDVSVYGGTSTIVCRNYTRNVPQNKHLNGIGPMSVPEEYIEGVIWNGVNSDAEYIDGRAQATYRSYLPEPGEFHEADETLSAYIDGWVYDFITGKKEIGDESVWEEYRSGLTGYR